MAETGTHQCPGPGCKAEVGQGQLMCPVHWRLVPNTLKRAVYRTWRGGQGYGTKAHRAAMAAAIEAIGGSWTDDGGRDG